MIAARLYHFNAVHSLPDFPDPWNRVHGHRYTIELVGEFNHEETDEIWAAVRDQYENQDLNQFVQPTTVEKLAEFFARLFGEDGITQVKVWEDDDRWGLWEA